MAVTWPPGLQQKFNVDNFSVAYGNTLVRSEVDAGLAKVRSRYTDGVDNYNCSIDLDIDDWNIIYDFFKTSLNNGALTFNFYNPLSEVTDEFRFLNPPQFSPIGGRLFRVTMSWERIP